MNRNITDLLNAGSGAAQKAQGESLKTFLASLTSSSLVLLVGSIIYIILKFKFPEYYRQQAHQLDKKCTLVPLSPRLLMRPPEFPLKHKFGFENYLLDRYLYTLTRLFILLGITILPVLVPLNLLDGKNQLGGVNGLDRLSFSNVSLLHTNRYWAHFALALLSTILVCYILQHELRAYEHLQQSSATGYFPYQKPSILVFSESKVPLSDKIIRHHFRNLLGGVCDVTINRDYSLLRSKLKKRNICAGKLEIAETSFAQSSGPQSKIDAIHYLRLEFIRYSHEIEQHQQHPDDFPQLNSAFVYFSNPISMSLAALAIEARIPPCWTLKHWTTPEDTIWKNMSITWWQRFFRTVLSYFLVSSLILGYAAPVAFIGSLSQIEYLASFFSRLIWLNALPNWVIASIQGILPAILLAILTTIVPSMIRILANLQGNYSYRAWENQVQLYYFTFLFIQVFLTASLSAGITTVLGEMNKIEGIPATLAKNLPKACNFFFSYIIIHTFSTVVSTLVQIEGIVSSYIFSPLFDKTGRQIWQRQHNLQVHKWGTFLPKLTNIACIGLIYSVIAPLILPINIIYFGTLWLLYRLYPPNLVDSGLQASEVFYPTAIYQLFTGIYFMQLCLAGLFFLVRDNENKATCTTQALLTIFMLCLTGIFHFSLNRQYQSFDNNSDCIEAGGVINYIQGNLLTTEPPTLWIPHPKNNEEVVDAIHSFDKIPINISTGVFFNKQGKLEIKGSPPSVIVC